MVADLSRFLSKRTEYTRVSIVREILKIAEGREIISLAGGLPDPASFPKEELAEIAKQVIEQHGDLALQYSPTRGIRPFREELSKFMERHGIPAQPDEILVTTGSQQAIDVVTKTLINPGDTIALGLPTYLAAINTFRVYEARFLGIPVDENGMNTEVLEKRLKECRDKGVHVKLVYTIPTAQNPSGVSMSMERRKHLLELAEEYDFLVVEDDPYSYFTFEPVEYKSLRAMDRSGRVIYMSTFSKILAPGLRIGWIAADKELVGYFELTKQHMDLHTPTLSQFIATEALRRSVIEKHLPRVVELYRRKRDAMLSAMEQHFPEGSRWAKPVGGLFIFAYLPEGIDTYELLPKAVDRGVAYVPGNSFFVDGGGRNTLRLNFSNPPIEKIEKAISILGSLFKEALDR